MPQDSHISVDLKPLWDLAAEWHQEIKECCPKYMVMCSSCTQQLRDVKALEKALKELEPKWSDSGTRCP